MRRTVCDDDQGQQPDSSIFANTCHARNDTSTTDENLAAYHEVGDEGSEHVRQMTCHAEADLSHLQKPIAEG